MDKYILILAPKFWQVFYSLCIVIIYIQNLLAAWFRNLASSQIVVQCLSLYNGIYFYFAEKTFCHEYWKKSLLSKKLYENEISAKENIYFYYATHQLFSPHIFVPHLATSVLQLGMNLLSHIKLNYVKLTCKNHLETFSIHAKFWESSCFHMILPVKSSLFSAAAVLLLIIKYALSSGSLNVFKDQVSYAVMLLTFSTYHCKNSFSFSSYNAMTNGRSQFHLDGYALIGKDELHGNRCRKGGESAVLKIKYNIS